MRYDQMLKIQKRFWDFIFGTPEDVDKDFRWWNYLIILIKVSTPILSIYFFIIQNWYYGIICLVAFICDTLISISLYKRYKAYNEYKKITKELHLRDSR